jgi:hypothetical protein
MKEKREKENDLIKIQIRSPVTTSHKDQRSDADGKEGLDGRNCKKVNGG